MHQSVGSTKTAIRCKRTLRNCAHRVSKSLNIRINFHFKVSSVPFIERTVNYQYLLANNQSFYYIRSLVVKHPV